MSPIEKQRARFKGKVVPQPFQRHSHAITKLDKEKNVHDAP